MRKILSVITPVGPDATYLLATGRSLVGQPLPDGWELEWVVVCDHRDTDLHPAVTGLPLRLQVGRTHERAQGPAAARNVAATMAAGSVLLSLDADDQVASGALGPLLARLLTSPGGWAAWQRWTVVDRLGEQIKQRESPLPSGGVPAGTLWRHRRERGAMPFPPSAVMLRAPAVWAAGGWPALAVEEDVALLLAMDRVGGGYLSAERGLLSRKHPEQATARPDLLPFGVADEWLTRRGLA